MRIYNTVARWQGKVSGASILPNISFPNGGKATIVFGKNFNEEAHNDFVKFVSTLQK